MRHRTVLIGWLVISLLLPNVASQDSDGDGYEDDVDHRDDEDAHLVLALVHWDANSSGEWDSSSGLPDPYFQVCVEADGESVDCFTSPTWENTLELDTAWNLTINIPDDSSNIRFIIECKDNDLANDDECDMNDEADKWRGEFVFSWLLTSTQTFQLTGVGDNVSQNRDVNATWEVLSPSTNLDSDDDGVDDSNDAFPNDASQTSDADGDGYGDNPDGTSPDAFPMDDTQWSDADGDGYGDNPQGTNADKFPNDATQWSDQDGDGYGDNKSGNNPDAFHLDDTQWSDQDGDGFGDNPQGTNPDAFPNDATQWSDADGDGYSDQPGGTNPDLCPNSPTSQVDEEGCAEIEKVDSDGDGVTDVNDECLNTPLSKEVDASGCPLARNQTNVISEISTLQQAAAVFGILASILGIVGFFIKRAKDKKDAKQAEVDRQIWNFRDEAITKTARTVEAALQDDENT